jgi:hypothetical protein
MEEEGVVLSRFARLLGVESQHAGFEQKAVGVLRGGLDVAIGFDVAGFVTESFLNVFIGRDGAEVEGNANGAVGIGVGFTHGAFEMAPVDVGVGKLTGEVGAVNLLVLLTKIGVTQALACDCEFRSREEQSEAEALNGNAEPGHEGIFAFEKEGAASTKVPHLGALSNG